MGDEDEQDESTALDDNDKGDDLFTFSSLVFAICGCSLIIVFCLLLAAFLLFPNTVARLGHGALHQGGERDSGPNKTPTPTEPANASVSSSFTLFLSTVHEPLTESVTATTEEDTTDAITTTTQKKKPSSSKATPTTKKKATTTTTTKLTTKGTTTTTKTPMPVNRLICTLDATMALKEVWELPKDGVCDFTFYQARERVRALLDSSKSKRDARLELLFRTAAMHVKTEYGVSFDYETRDILPKLLSEDALAQDSLESFWKKKIYHYAYLTLPYFDLDDRSYKSVYYALKKVKDIIHKGKKPSRPSYFLVGDYFNSEQRFTEASNNIKKILHVDGIVIYGHLMHDDRGKGQVLPPTFWNSSKIISKTSYPYNLDSAHWALQELPKRHLGHTRFFLSVALGGRAYDTPEKQAFLAKSGTDAGTPLWIDMAKVCGNTSWVEGFHDTTPIGAYYENVNASKMVTYDNDRSFRDKLCRGKKSLLKANYGLVAYNVHLDDANNKCRTGGYKHLKFLRKLERFLNERFVADYDYDECTKLWGGMERK